MGWACTAKGGGRESTLSSMISNASFASLGAAPGMLALVAMLAYGVAALPAQAAARLPAPALVAGWLLHALVLALDIGGWGRGEPGARLGFGPVLSLTVWLVLAVHEVESRFVPLPGVRRALAISGAVAVLTAWAFPGDVRPALSALAPVHWVLGVASYALFGAAVLHASMLDAAERRLRPQPAGRALASGTAGQTAMSGHPGPMGVPLLRRERLTFRFVEAGFAVPSGDSPIIPLILGDSDVTLKYATALRAAGFMVSAIRPPTVPVRTGRIRISLRRGLSPVVLSSFLAALKGVTA